MKNILNKFSLRDVLTRMVSCFEIKHLENVRNLIMIIYNVIQLRNLSLSLPLCVLLGFELNFT